MGPSLSKRTDSTSIDMMIQMATGKFKTGAPSGDLGFVDVRDVAQAHILAGFSSTASGRHICVGDHKTFLDLANNQNQLPTISTSLEVCPEVAILADSSFFRFLPEICETEYWNRYQV